MQNHQFAGPWQAVIFQRWTGLCNGAFSALGSSFDAVMSCRDVHLLGELHPGRRHGCLCPGGFFFCSGSRGTQPDFSSLCMFLPILSTDACLGITWGTGEQGMLWAPAMPPQLLWDRQECFLFFPCRKSPVCNSHDRSQSSNILV